MLLALSQRFMVSCMKLRKAHRLPAVNPEYQACVSGSYVTFAVLMTLHKLTTEWNRGGAISRTFLPDWWVWAEFQIKKNTPLDQYLKMYFKASVYYLQSSLVCIYSYRLHYLNSLQRGSVRSWWRPNWSRWSWFGWGGWPRWDSTFFIDSVHSGVWGQWRKAERNKGIPLNRSWSGKVTLVEGKAGLQLCIFVLVFHVKFVSPLSLVQSTVKMVSCSRLSPCCKSTVSWC